jgi:hypothetical protein
MEWWIVTHLVAVLVGGTIGAIAIALVVAAKERRPDPTHWDPHL